MSPSLPGKGKKSGFQRDFGRRLGHLANVLSARRGVAGATFADRLGDRVGIEADCTAGIVIARYWKCDAAGVTVRIEDRDDRDAQCIGYHDRELFLVCVDHEHDVGKPAHDTYSAKAM